MQHDGLLFETDVHDVVVGVPGGSIFSRRWNPGYSIHPPIILLHDSLGSVDQWRDFPEALARATTRNVIAYDRLGFGRSTARKGLPSINFIDEEAEIFFPTIKCALGVTRFSLFGHSVGGGMAVAIAASHGDECEAVITESAQAFMEPRTLSGIQAAREQFTDAQQFEKLVRWHDDKAQWVLDAWTDVWLSPEFSTWSLDNYLERVRCPVLAIHGDSDGYGSEEFPRRISKKTMGPSEMAILENCGHVPHRERKSEVLLLAANFLERFA